MSEPIFEPSDTHDDAPRYTMRAVEDYRWLGDFGPEAVKACGLDPAALDDDSDHADVPLVLAANSLGLRYAHIVEEPAFRVAVDKAARDQNLGRPTMHLSRQWRFPLQERGMFAAETGKPALILPVCNSETVLRNLNGEARCATSATLSLLQLGASFEENIADLIALPLDGGRALSLTGYTVAVGNFAADHEGRLGIFARGRKWLDAHFAGLRALTGGINPQAAIAEHEDAIFAAPASVLLVEPRAFEWRVCRHDCAIALDVSDILCPDSRSLAQFIAAEMKRPDVVRAMPIVHGPAEKARAA